MKAGARAESEISLDRPPDASGKGTLTPTFHEQGPKGATASEVRSKASARRGRVLVVDDDAAMRHVLEGILRSDGHDVVVVADGEEAVAMYRALAGAVDLVVIDVSMPGMDGYETFRQLRSIRADARIILCSGSADPKRVERALADGAFGFIAKPFDASQVLTMVSDVGVLGIWEAPDLDRSW